MRIAADGADEKADDAYDEALHGTASAEHRYHGYPEHSQHEEFGGAEGQDQGPEDGHREGKHHRAKEPAHQRCHVRGAQRAPGLAAFGHRMAVENGGLGGRRPRYAEQNRWHRIGRADDGMEPDQNGEGRKGVHVEGEGQENGQADDAAQPRDGAEGEAHDHAERQQGETARDEKILDRFECGFEHAPTVLHAPNAQRVSRCRRAGSGSSR